MARIGTVIDGKYEVLKEIGRGGMSIVYLAMDRRLNKQWAVKEIRKKGGGGDDALVINSLIAEADMMKKLDHPALPRIVDIIDSGVTIYIVMDYIEGESLDKILSEYGAQPEEAVIGWAKQLADVLSYLHGQKPPIVYRDMKPANVMLKPEGNIKIIDFGIAREYKEQNLADTTVLGTRGYAPPEQYGGRTDPRSDIFALGMTLHHLLTGIDPRRGEPYAPVRQYNPELSEGIERIIDRCVEPAVENRYPSCADLLYDLEHPQLITRGYRKRQRMKLAAFLTCASLALVLAAAGSVLHLTAKSLSNRDYDGNIASSDPERYYAAVEIYPERTAAYEQLIEYCKNHETGNDEIMRVGNAIENYAAALNPARPETAALYYEMGRLYFSRWEGSFRSRAVNAANFFQAAAESEAEFDKKEAAVCYDLICRFITSQSAASEHSLEDYRALFEEIDRAAAVMEEASDGEANYDRISLYYAAILLIHDQAEYIAGVGIDRETVLGRMEALYKKTEAITSTLTYVNDLKAEITETFDSFVVSISAKYSEVEKRRGAGGG